MATDALKTGTYIGATAEELGAAAKADKAAAAISQKALFRRRGEIRLTEDRLELSGWGDDGTLSLTRGDLVEVKREFTDLYGRFIGGLLDAGKPLILVTREQTIYLLIDRKELMETTSDRQWEKELTAWLAE